MQYTISDIANLLKVWSKKTAAQKLGISTIALNDLIKGVSQLAAVSQPIRNTPFTLLNNGQVLLGSDNEDAQDFEVAVLRDMLINTEKSKVAETLGVSTVTLNKVIRAFPQHFENLPKAVKLPFTLVGDDGAPVVILKGVEVTEPTVEIEEPSSLSIVSEVEEIIDEVEEILDENEPQSEMPSNW